MVEDFLGVIRKFSDGSFAGRSVEAFGSFVRMLNPAIVQVVAWQLAPLAICVRIAAPYFGLLRGRLVGSVSMAWFALVFSLLRLSLMMLVIAIESRACGRCALNQASVQISS